MHPKHENGNRVQIKQGRAAVSAESFPQAVQFQKSRAWGERLRCMTSHQCCHDLSAIQQSAPPTTTTTTDHHYHEKILSTQDLTKLRVWKARSLALELLCLKASATSPRERSYRWALKGTYVCRRSDRRRCRCLHNPASRLLPLHRRDRYSVTPWGSRSVDESRQIINILENNSQSDVGTGDQLENVFITAKTASLLFFVNSTVQSTESYNERHKTDEKSCWVQYIASNKMFTSRQPNLTCSRHQSSIAFMANMCANTANEMVNSHSNKHKYKSWYNSFDAGSAISMEGVNLAVFVNKRWWWKVIYCNFTVALKSIKGRRWKKKWHEWPRSWKS